jgi:hypothetical protein
VARGVDVAWAAGLFEGEGSCFIGSGQRQPVAYLAMTDEDVVSKFHAIVGVGNVRSYQRPGKYKRYWQWSAQSRDDVIHVLGMLWPHLGARRQERASEVMWHAMKIQPRNGPRSRCKRGHDLTDADNIYFHVKTGKRHCRTCRTEYGRLRRLGA